MIKLSITAVTGPASGPGVTHPSCSGGGGSNPPRKLNIVIIVPVSEVLRLLSAQAGLWRVRYKPADYLSLNTPALMAAAGQGDSKLWTPYTLSNFLLGHFLSLRECFWHQQQ